MGKTFEPLSPDFRLHAEGLYLRPITLEDAEMVLGWRNSSFVRNFFFYRLPITMEEELDWLNNKAFKGLVFQFVICTEEDVPVGSVYLQHYDEEKNSIESGIFMSEHCVGNGVGSKAFALVSRVFAFEYLKVDSVFSRVFADNAASIRMNEKAGYVKTLLTEGTIIPDGTRVVVQEMELRREMVEHE